LSDGSGFWSNLRDSDKNTYKLPLRLTVELTDYLKSPLRRHPLPSPETESLLEYFKTFCTSLSQEETPFEQVIRELDGQTGVDSLVDDVGDLETLDLSDWEEFVH